MSTKVMLIAGALLFSATASADMVITPVGEPFEGNSWWYQFSIAGDSPFDFMAVRMVSPGDSFVGWQREGVGVYSAIGDAPDGYAEESPAGYPTNEFFSSEGWTSYFVNPPTVAYAEGPSAITLLWFFVGFAGTPWDDLEFDLALYNGTTWLGSGHLYWDSSLYNPDDPNTIPWVISEGGWDPGVIPAPGAALLGLVGLGCIARIRRCLA